MWYIPYVKMGFFFPPKDKNEIKNLGVLCTLLGKLPDDTILAAFSALSSLGSGFLDVFHFH